MLALTSLILLPKSVGLSNPWLISSLTWRNTLGVLGIYQLRDNAGPLYAVEGLAGLQAVSGF